MSSLAYTRSHVSHSYSAQSLFLNKCFPLSIPVLKFPLLSSPILTFACPSQIWSSIYVLFPYLVKPAAFTSARRSEEDKISSNQINWSQLLYLLPNFTFVRRFAFAWVSVRSSFEKFSFTFHCFLVAVLVLVIDTPKNHIRLCDITNFHKIKMSSFQCGHLRIINNVTGTKAALVL